ncbi:MAG TPA: FAD-dependent monooxygenase [Pseudonocardia sp.]|uniref:FAD-dependent monooxygenase n=1 Tax=Pseudonocardia sp. TaxID=60912 RepID=UPI002BC65BBC|nr:FAD-dependent monooxygenase [Pseudonocardia sp.]HTF47166.1 FAD-dependent monooxygenase [Pseudonocardia sp.]
MRVVCLGGGPAGLYFAILTKLRDPDSDVVVVERNPRGVTHGWGVVFWDDLLHSLYRTDSTTAELLKANALQWWAQEVHVGAQPPAQAGGYGFAIGRHELLTILTDRAIALGVTVQFDRTATTLADWSDADLIVASDGANSPVRTQLAEHFKPQIEVGTNYYIWLGTNKTFDAFTFAFEKTPAGWLWFHGYRFNDKTSTCIVECPSSTWHELELDRLGPDEGISVVQKIFADKLGGHELTNKLGGASTARWLNFQRVSNHAWFHKNIVLVGDAAHTTHFSIGSGTRLAIEDSIALDQAIRQHHDLPAALRQYQIERKAATELRQAAADSSAKWFENINALGEQMDSDPVRFAYSLRTRKEGSPSGVSWLLHRATQYPLGRAGRRWVSTVKRKASARAER